MATDRRCGGADNTNRPKIKPAQSVCIGKKAQCTHTHTHIIRVPFFPSFFPLPPPSPSHHHFCSGTKAARGSVLGSKKGSGACSVGRCGL